MYHHRLCYHIYQLRQKEQIIRLMNSKFCWPVLRNTPILLRTKGRTDKTTNKNENAWEALAN